MGITSSAWPVNELNEIVVKQDKVVTILLGLLIKISYLSTVGLMLVGVSPEYVLPSGVTLHNFK